MNRGAWKVDWRNLIERFQDTPGGDYTRFGHIVITNITWQPGHK